MDEDNSTLENITDWYEICVNYENYDHQQNERTSEQDAADERQFPWKNLTDWYEISVCYEKYHLQVNQSSSHKNYKVVNKLDLTENSTKNSGKNEKVSRRERSAESSRRQQKKRWKNRVERRKFPAGKPFGVIVHPRDPREVPEDHSET